MHKFTIAECRKLREWGMEQYPDESRTRYHDLPAPYRGSVFWGWDDKRSDYPYYLIPHLEDLLSFVVVLRPSAWSINLSWDHDNKTFEASSDYPRHCELCDDGCEAIATDPDPCRAVFNLIAKLKDAKDGVA